MPRVYQQIDWSNGGDGIVCRATRQVGGRHARQDRRARAELAVALLPAQHAHQRRRCSRRRWSTSSRRTPSRPRRRSTRTSRSPCVVSWAPDIYNLADAKGNKMLVNTQTANKLIADVWFARADFAKDNPAIIEGLVRGIFEAMETLKTQDSEGAGRRSSWPPATPFPRRTRSPCSATRTRRTTPRTASSSSTRTTRRTSSARGTRRTSSIGRSAASSGNPVPFDQVMDFSVIQKLGSEPSTRTQKNEYQVQFVPTSATAVQAESNEILTKTHRHPVLSRTPTTSTRRSTRPWTERRCRSCTIRTRRSSSRRRASSPGSSVRRASSSRATPTRRCESSGTVTAADVQELSLRRANSVKQALLRKFPSLQPNQFTTVGKGWDRPADPGDPNNYAKNRRVEIKVYPLESK